MAKSKKISARICAHSLNYIDNETCVEMIRPKTMYVSSRDHPVNNRFVFLIKSREKSLKGKLIIFVENWRAKRSYTCLSLHHRRALSLVTKKKQEISTF